MACRPLSLCTNYISKFYDIIICNWQNVWYDAHETQLLVSSLTSLKTNTCCKLSIHLCTESVSWKVKWMLWCFIVEAERSPVGDAGGGADEDVHVAVFKRLWGRWRSQSIQAWQVSEYRASTIHYAVLSVLALVDDAQWLAGVTDWSLGPSSTEKVNSR